MIYNTYNDDDDDYVVDGDDDDDDDDIDDDDDLRSMTANPGASSLQHLVERGLLLTRRARCSRWNISLIHYHHHHHHGGTSL